MKISELKKLTVDSYNAAKELKKESIMKKNEIPYYSKERENELEQKVHEYELKLEKCKEFFNIKISDFTKIFGKKLIEYDKNLRLIYVLTDERHDAVDYFEGYEYNHYYTYAAKIFDKNENELAKLFEIHTDYPISIFSDYNKAINLFNNGIIKSYKTINNGKKIPDVLDDAIWDTLTENFKNETNEKINNNKLKIKELQNEISKLNKELKTNKEFLDNSTLDFDLWLLKF